MTEQEQASALARWLEQPAGTPPPEGLDPEAVEAVYAIRPDLAPEPSLTAEDILSGLDLGGAGSAGGSGAAGPGGSEIPPTPITAAPTGWRSANRVAGVAVLLATAATLLVVALPVLEEGPAQADRALETEVAAAPARSADPISSLDGSTYEAEPAAAAPATQTTAPAEGSAPARVARGPEAAPVGGEATDAPPADAVADADLPAEEEGALDFAGEQRVRMSGEDALIPEAEAALRQLDEGDDAVAGLDEDVLDEEASSRAAEGYAAPQAAAQADLEAKSGISKEEASRAEARKARPKKARPVAKDAPGSARQGAVPADYDPDAWRRTADPATIARIERALEAARAEAALGNPGRAADLMAAEIGPPSDAGQYAAILAATWRLEAGDPDGAIAHIQQGLALSGANSAYRSYLFVLYGDALDRKGDRPNAETQWQDAAELNVERY